MSLTISGSPLKEQSLLAEDDAFSDDDQSPVMKNPFSTTNLKITSANRSEMKKQLGGLYSTPDANFKVERRVRRSVSSLDVDPKSTQSAILEDSYTKSSSTMLENTEIAESGSEEMSPVILNPFDITTCKCYFLYLEIIFTGYNK